MSEQKLLTIIWGEGLDMWITKDMCQFPYTLAKYYGWQATFCYFLGDHELANDEYEKFVTLRCLGRAADYHDEAVRAKEYIYQHKDEIDVIMLFAYGGNSYKIANFAKKINSGIKIWIKLDMNENGFSHFIDGSVIRCVKNYINRWKSRNVDLFSVETQYYYSKLKENIVFRDRIIYLPNCVSEFKVDEVQVDSITLRKNVIIACGRIGEYVKNHELLLEAVALLPKEIIQDWQVIFVGPVREEFKDYIKAFFERHSALKNAVCFMGAEYDRTTLYGIYKSSKIFCMTSRSEGFPLAAVEAIYYGAYPVVTNFGRAVNDITDSGRLGKIVSSSNAADLATTLESVMKSKDLIESCASIEARARELFDYKSATRPLFEWLTDFVIK